LGNLGMLDRSEEEALCKEVLSGKLEEVDTELAAEALCTAGLSGTFEEVDTALVAEALCMALLSGTLEEVDTVSALAVEALCMAVLLGILDTAGAEDKVELDTLREGRWDKWQVLQELLSWGTVIGLHIQ